MAADISTAAVEALVRRAREEPDATRARRANALANALAVVQARKAKDPHSWSPKAQEVLRSKPLVLEQHA